MPLGGRHGWRGKSDRPATVAFVLTGVEDVSRAVADFVHLVTVWRALPYLDPGLPLDALPADWEGVAAEELFFALRAKLAGPAREHAMSVLWSRG